MNWKRGSIAGVVGLIELCACQRSPAYRRDSDLTRTETPLTYSTAQEKASPTQQAEAIGQPKKQVVVLNFWNDTPVQQPDLGLFGANELRRGLFLTQRVILSPEVKTNLGTVDFIQGEKVKIAQLMREGRRLGVAVLIIGRITKIVFRQRGDDVGLLRQKQSISAVDVEIKIFDVGGGREVMAVSRSAEAVSNAMVALESENIESAEYRAELTKLAIRNATALFVPDVVKTVEKMTWEGRIAKVTGSKVYINAGRASGLVAGDILKVLAIGDDVYDPITGAFLGRTPGQLKGTVEVVDFIGTDGAVTEIHTGSNFQSGDVVRLY